MIDANRTLIVGLDIAYKGGLAIVDQRDGRLLHEFAWNVQSDQDGIERETKRMPARGDTVHPNTQYTDYLTLCPFCKRPTLVTVNRKNMKPTKTVKQMLDMGAACEHYRRCQIEDDLSAVTGEFQRASEGRTRPWEVWRRIDAFFHRENVYARAGHFVFSKMYAQIMTWKKINADGTFEVKRGGNIRTQLDLSEIKGFLLGCLIMRLKGLGYDPFAGDIIVTERTDSTSRKNLSLPPKKEDAHRVLAMIFKPQPLPTSEDVRDALIFALGYREEIRRDAILKKGTTR